MELQGSAVLHYQLIEKLGSGGMGEIYKAQDTRLNRFVAIKVLPPSQSGDPERQRRFMQEAQAASALNHPNIVTVHNIIQEGDTLYIVMEYIAGKTLQEIIPAGGLRVSQVLRSAAQMADALAAAHAAGIIHRDLKPANVMITESGLVKVLDFGLAKWTGGTAPVGTSAAAAGSAATGTAHSADQTTILESPLTMEGSIMGTLNYMAPEQAEGKRVDSRADIFSFGAVLYEMTTGRKAFEGDSAVATLSAVLRDEVTPITGLAPDVPRELEEIIGRCLRKAPQARWQSMGEVETALNNLRRKSDAGLTPAPPATASLPMAPKANAARNPRKRSIVAGAGVALLAVAILSGWWWTSSRQANTRPSATVPTSAPAVATPLLTTPAAVSNPADAVLTNENIIAMWAVKVPIPSILEQMRSSKTNFDLSPEAIIGLTASGVPATVIEAMRYPKRGPVPNAAAQPSAALPSASLPSPSTPIAPAAGASPTIAAVPSAPAIVPENKPAVQLASVKLNDALPFRIVLTEDVPVDAAENQALSFRVAEGLQVGDMVVIAKGTTVSGEVMGEVGKKKFLGIGGASKLSFRLLSAESVENEKIRVRAVPSVKGDGLTSRPFDTGKGPRPKDVAAARGTEYIAYIDGAQTVSIHK